MDSTGLVVNTLNREQLDAVTASTSHHLLVLAGAGCGKTTVLTHRIAYLVSCGIPLRRILALTFTRNAASEMADRVALIAGLGKRGLGAMILTFHSFSLRVLRASFEGIVNFSRIGFKGAPRFCTESERLSLVSDSCTAVERELLGPDLQEIDALIERFTVFPESVDDVEREKSAAIRNAAARLTKLKKERGAWDFSDLVGGVVTLFDRVPEIRKRWSGAFDALLVDEFQDTNPFQIRLVRQLLGVKGRIFAVGDDDQAIYGFRGADTRPTLAFPSFFPEARIIKLQTNYRSVPEILACANRIFHGKDPSYRKVLKPAVLRKTPGIPPTKHRFETQGAMADWIIEEAQRCSGAMNVPAGEMACIFRINLSVHWISAYYREKGVPESMYPRLLTVHKSKGLEFPVVFLGDMEESVFPSYRENRNVRIRTLRDCIHFLLAYGAKPECDWEEEKRLFYVAVTRARERLFLLHAGTRMVRGRDRTLRASRFLRLF